VVIHTDGGLQTKSRARRLGGRLLRQREHVPRDVRWASPAQTSNNRMELTAPIMGVGGAYPTGGWCTSTQTAPTSANGITKWVLGWERKRLEDRRESRPVKKTFDLWQRAPSGPGARPIGSSGSGSKGHAGVARQRTGRRKLATRGMQGSDRLGAADATASSPWDSTYTVQRVVKPTYRG